MANPLDARTVDSYLDELTTVLETAADGAAVITAMTAYDTAQLSSRLKQTIGHYTGARRTTQAQLALINDALGQL